MMREHNQMNAQMMQILNCCKGGWRMDQVQDMKKEEDIMKGEITIKDPVTQEVLVGLRDISCMFTQTRKFYASEESRRSPSEVSHVRHQRRRYELDSL
jgi:hypothetical protein